MTDQPDTPPSGQKPDDVLAAARDRLAESMAASSENRRRYVEDVAFSCAVDQWDDAVKRARGPNRPALTFNRLNQVVKQIIGDYRQNKLAIKVLPASGDASEETADLMAGLIRNIEQQSNADVAYANGLECSARGNLGWFRVVTEYCSDDVFDQDLVIRPIHNPLTVYDDPSARLITREDANWRIVTEMVPKEKFKRLYPKAKGTSFEGTDDQWGDKDSVRVAEYYTKETYPCRLVALSDGTAVRIDSDEQLEALTQLGLTVTNERTVERTRVRWRKITGSEILDERVYNTKYIPVIPVVGEEVNVEGKVVLRSAIAYAKDAQRMHNYWRSTATETVALQPRSTWLVTPEHIQTFEAEWDNANTTPRPYLPYNFDGNQPPPQRLEPPSPPMGEMAMGGNATDEIKATTGLYDASLGAQGNETSGVAINARRAEGDAATFIFIDNLKQAIEHCGRVLIDWIPEVYDAERTVRILDLEGKPSTETVNQEHYDPVTGVTRILNSLRVGKYDVVVEAGPSFATKRREAVAGMVELLRTAPQIFSLAGDLIVKNLNRPGADTIAERIKRSMPPQITTDPDSPEGQAMKNQPPPVPPEVQQQQAEQQRKQEEFQQNMAMQQQKAEQDMTLKQQEFAAKKDLENRKFVFDQQMAEKEFQLRVQESGIAAAIDLKSQAVLKHIDHAHATHATLVQAAVRPQPEEKE